MDWKKAAPELVDFLASAMEPFACQRKIMFGYPAYFLNGNMFVGLHQDNIILRLSEADRKELLSQWDEAAPFEPMPGRAMKEYVVVPDALYSNPHEFRAWLERAYQHASSLPLKQEKLKPKKK